MAQNVLQAGPIAHMFPILNRFDFRLMVVMAEESSTAAEHVLNLCTGWWLESVIKLMPGPRVVGSM